jgi:pSer/pThr/pTyr-binding forkhead associated (FHA) protein
LHARLTYDARDMEYFLEDVGSRNGTFIGSRRVHERDVIQPGELFRIGRTWLRLDHPPSDIGTR